MQQNGKNVILHKALDALYGLILPHPASLWSQTASRSWASWEQAGHLPTTCAAIVKQIKHPFAGCWTSRHFVFSHRETHQSDCAAVVVAVAVVWLLSLPGLLIPRFFPWHMLNASSSPMTVFYFHEALLLHPGLLWPVASCGVHQCSGIPCDVQ